MFFDDGLSSFPLAGTAQRGSIDPEEIFPDNSFYADAYETPGDPYKKLEIPVSPWISQILQFAVLGILIFFSAYTAYLVFSQGKHYQALAEENIQHVFEFPAPRGEILDRNGKVLATSIPGFQLELQLHEFQGNNANARALALAIADSDPDITNSIEKKITDAQRKHIDRIVLAKNITLDELPGLHKRVDGFPGLFYRENFIRSYPYGPAAAHLLGYTGDPSAQDLTQRPNVSPEVDVGKYGLEAFYDSLLQGTAGEAATLVDAKGNVLGEEIIKQASAGQPLRITLDADLQKISYDTLLTHLQQKHLQKGALVALDPRNGSIRALVSLPSFDPNAFARGMSTQEYQALQQNAAQPLFDRAIAGTYPSGSVIKPLLALGALQEHIISPDKIMMTSGSISVPSKYDPSIVYTFHDWRNNGAVDMRRAIAVSDDIYFYTIGGGHNDQQGLGPDKIAKYLGIFGWGQRTGIDLSGEASGFIPTPQWKKETTGQDWFLGDTYHISIGQGGILATPLQIAESISAIANSGTLYQAHILEKQAPQSVHLPFSSDMMRVSQEGMREAVLEGTSQLLKDLPFNAAGKTGTAQTVSGVDTHAWFVTYAPYENPSLVIAIIMENGGEGSEATHVANEILQKYQGLTE